MFHGERRKGKWRCLSLSRAPSLRLRLVTLSRCAVLREEGGEGDVLANFSRARGQRRRRENRAGIGRKEGRGQRRCRSRLSESMQAWIRVLRRGKCRLRQDANPRECAGRRKREGRGAETWMINARIHEGREKLQGPGSGEARRKKFTAL